jgi:DNA-directed RNA polymerase III subunit RPC11
MLRVSRVAPGDPTTEDHVGQNRFECSTCPYQFVITKRYFERKTIHKKEVEDILGGKDAWANVDKTPGAFKLISFVEYDLRVKSAMPE